MSVCLGSCPSRPAPLKPKGGWALTWGLSSLSLIAGSKVSFAVTLFVVVLGIAVALFTVLAMTAISSTCSST